SIEPGFNWEEGESSVLGLKDTLVDSAPSPFEDAAHEEVRAKVEQELRSVPEPYRTVVILRDIEDLAYEEVAEVLQISLGTVKSRLVRGRVALRERLEAYVRENGRELGLSREKVKSVPSTKATEVVTRS